MGSMVFEGSGLSVRTDLLKDEGKHMTLEYLISHYGYVALVIGTFLEGESIHEYYSEGQNSRC
jgi:hypothetical protein